MNSNMEVVNKENLDYHSLTVEDWVSSFLSFRSSEESRREFVTETIREVIISLHALNFKQEKLWGQLAELGESDPDWAELNEVHEELLNQRKNLQLILRALTFGEWE